MRMPSIGCVGDMLNDSSLGSAHRAAIARQVAAHPGYPDDDRATARAWLRSQGITPTPTNSPAGH